MVLSISIILKHYRNSPIYRLLGFLFVCLSFIPLFAHAELPLKIENPITEPGQWKLETGLTYRHTHRSQITIGKPLFVVTESNQVISIPTDVHQEQINQNTLMPSIGLRYGLTPKVELYGKTAWSMQHTRHSHDLESKITQHHRFENVWLGINYHLIDHSEVNVLGFMESTLAEQRKSMVYGKTAVLGTTLYRSMDPLVLSLTTTYQHYFKDHQDLNHSRISHALMLNPQVAFAANDQITLSSGLTWRYLNINHCYPVRRHTVNQVSLSDQLNSTAIGLNLGLAYSYSPQTTLLLRNHVDLTGRGGAEIGVSVQVGL